MAFSFIHISDIHFNQEDRGALRVVHEYVARREPDVVIASGDLTALGARSEMKAAFAWLRALPAPVLATPGNHDTPYFQVTPRLFFPFLYFDRESRGVRTGPWIEREFAIAPINTARGVQLRKNWALGALSSGQARRAAEAIAGAPAEAFKIVVTHHPLIWPTHAPIPGDTRGGERGASLLMQAGAQLFLSGHLHRGGVEELERDGHVAVFANAGTLSIRQRGEPPGFLCGRYDDGVLDIERVFINGDVGESVSIFRSTRGARGSARATETAAG